MRFYGKTHTGRCAMRPIRRALDANRLLTTGSSSKMDATSEKERALAAHDDAITPVLAMQFAAAR